MSRFLSVPRSRARVVRIENNSTAASKRRRPRPITCRRRGSSSFLYSWPPDRTAPAHLSLTMHFHLRLNRGHPNGRKLNQADDGEARRRNRKEASRRRRRLVWKLADETEKKRAARSLVALHLNAGRSTGGYRDPQRRHAPWPVLYTCAHLMEYGRRVVRAITDGLGRLPYDAERPRPRRETT